MTTMARCERCGATLGGLVGPGLCPACLMALAAEPGNHGSIDFPDSRDRHELQSESAEIAALDREPTHIGHYRILDCVGEGGMGIVYTAEQRHPIHRIVAIKIVKGGVDSLTVVARFEAERQALALMNHPNIAQVFEAGETQDGRPYFVMEHVHGESITAYCDRHRLTIPQRLELFIQACDAVEHAHQKAIIHRDLKPNNLLVSDRPDGPVLKVIDFGVAKALSHRLTEQTLFTEQGRVIGTPEYMSPEQAEISGIDLDTRTDVYSLGVVLYELLAGVQPFDSQTLRSAAHGDLQRLIRGQDPPRPGRKVVESADKGTSTAFYRRTSASSLSRMLLMELEWIPLKAMSKERAERYRSVAELADDVKNYLEGRPLIAGPQTGLYLFKKFVRKHLRAVAVATFVLVMDLGLVVALVIQTRRATHASQVAASESLGYQQQLHRAEQAEWEVNQRMAGKLIAVGDMEWRSNQLSEAEQSYLQSLDIVRTLKLSEESLFARLALLNNEQWPLMGFYGKSRGPGGFEEGAHVDALALAPDGYTAVTAEEDGSAKLWDLRTGILLRRFRDDEQERGTTFVSISPDGQRLLTASYDGKIRIWNIATGAKLGVFTHHTSDVFCARFSPVGHLVVSGDLQGNLKVWDYTTFEELWNLEAGQDGIATVALSSDGQRALTGGRGGAIKLWDLSRGQFLREIASRSMQINDLAFSSDGHTAISAGFDGKVKVWNLEQSEQQGRVIGTHTGRAWRVALSSDGRTIASGGDDGLRLWSIDHPNQLIQRFDGQVGQVLGVAFSKDDRMLVASGDGCALRVWQVEGSDALSWVDSNAQITCAAASDEGLAALGTGSGMVYLFDTATGQLLRELIAHTNAVRAVCIPPDCNQIVTCGDDGRICIWNAESGKLLHQLSGHTGPVIAMSLLPQNRALSAGSDQTIRLWDLGTGSQLATIGMHAGAVTSMAVSPDGQLIICGTSSGSCSMWSVSDAASVWSVPAQRGSIRAIVFYPDGKRALIAEGDGSIAALDAASGKLSDTFEPHCGAIRDLKMLSDGATLWIGTDDGTVHLFDTKKHNLLGSVKSGYTKLDSITFCPSGSIAIIAGAEEGNNKRSGIFLIKFAKAASERAFGQTMSQARAVLQRQPTNAEALATFGEWFALRGESRWAISLLEEAKSKGVTVSSLIQARCYWRAGRLSSAANAFRAARTNGEATPGYLDVCLESVLHAPGSGPASRSTRFANIQH